jgi:D-glycero-alpha-D-manno-heptose 1-phosphate guanylyltransferase
LTSPKPKLAIVLAGGLGARLRSVVSNVPKPMAPVQGRPFLESLFYFWKNQGINRFIFCVGYKSEFIIDHFGDSFDGCKIFYSIEDEPLGTGGAILKAVNQFKPVEPLIIINGDTFFEVNLYELDKFAKISKADWCFSLFKGDDNARYLPLTINLDGSLDLRLKKNVADDNDIKYNELNAYSNGGVYWVNPASFKLLPFSAGEKISLEDEIFTKSRELGLRMCGLPFSEIFIDIGLPDDYIRAQEMKCFSGNYERKHES